MSGVAYHWLSPETAPWLADTDIFDEDLRPDQLAAFLGDPGHTMRLACVNRRVVGMASGTIIYHPDKPKSLFVNEVAVLDTYQRRGIATQLLKDLGAWSRAQGCASLWVATEHNNDAARALYRSFNGREETGVVVYEW